MRCIPHVRWGLAQFLDQLPLKTRFTKEKRTLKTLVVCWEANYRAANKLVLTKIWPWKPIPWSGAALNVIYKANQSTNGPLNSRNCIIACPPVRSSWTDNEQLHTGSPNFGPRVVYTRPWRQCPNMGSYPNIVKNANFRGLRRIWEFSPTLRGNMVSWGFSFPVETHLKWRDSPAIELKVFRYTVTESKVELYMQNVNSALCGVGEC